MARSMLLEALVCSSVLLSACSANAPEKDGSDATTQAGDSARDDQAIRATNARWLELIRAKDAAAIAALYTEDGALMPPNAPMANSNQAIREGWQSMMQTPGFGLTFEPQTIVVSSSGDMALDRGTYELAMNPPDGPVRDSGKYVVVWRKVGDEWKVAADIFNSNQPVAQ